jgi:MFS family permease
VSQLRELLRIRDFRYLWTAQIASDFGDNLTALSLLILIQRLTGSTVAIAGLMISITLPALIFGVLSGVYVDRFDRRRMMIISDFLRAVLVVSFIFVDSAELLPLLYVIAFVQATIGTLFNPARSALLPRIVGKEKLLAANSVSQTSRIIFNLLGTTAAGILASVSTGFARAFIVDSLTFLLSAVLITRIGTSGAPRERDPSRVWDDMRAGFKVLVGSKPLQGMLVGAGVAMLGLGAVNVLGVPFIIGELGISEAFFGLVEFSQVAGMVISGSLVAVLAMKLRAPTLVSLGMVGVGIGVGLLAPSSEIWQLGLVLFGVGLFVTPTQAGVSTLSQTLIEDEMRGRVGGALSALISGANVLSMGVAGVAAAAIGIQTVFVLSGLIVVLAGILAGLLLRGVDVRRQPAPAPETV